jgi:hypothetical protein
MEVKRGETREKRAGKGSKIDASCVPGASWFGLSLPAAEGPYLTPCLVSLILSLHTIVIFEHPRLFHGSLALAGTLSQLWTLPFASLRGYGRYSWLGSGPEMQLLPTERGIRDGRWAHGMSTGALGIHSKI